MNVLLRPEYGHPVQYRKKIPGLYCDGVPVYILTELLLIPEIYKTVRSVYIHYTVMQGRLCGFGYPIGSRIL